jgi:hypothetical protein
MNIVVVLVILIIIIFLLSKKTNSNINEPHVINKSLCILVIIKNEAMVIDEWINHYIWQGVDHFYIIDNDSTDNTKDILNPYINKHIVSYFYREEQHRQNDHYNEIYKKYIRNNWDWVIVCDADEYFYYRGKKVLKEYINSLDQSNISNITINWKMFGSNGHITQPQSIRKSFLIRKKDLHKDFKAIINPLLTDRLYIHLHSHIGGISINNPIELALNHYAIMSKEYFEKIKMTRGDADDSKQNNLRDWNYFDKYNHKEVYDTELHDLVVKYENKKHLNIYNIECLIL